MRRLNHRNSMTTLLAVAVLVAAGDPLRADCSGCGHASCEVSHAVVPDEAPTASCCHKRSQPAEPVCPPVSTPCGECCRPGEPLARAEVAPTAEREQVNPLTVALVTAGFVPQTGDRTFTTWNLAETHTSAPPLRVLLCVWRN